jgi:hypothetical protein
MVTPTKTLTTEMCKLNLMQKLQGGHLRVFTKDKLNLTTLSFNEAYILLRVLMSIISPTCVYRSAN